MSVRVRAAKVLLAAAAAALLAACSRNPSILQDLGGSHAQITANLFWLFFIVCAGVWLAVIGMLIWALLARRSAIGEVEPDPLARNPAREGCLKIWVGSAVAATVALLTFLVGASYAVDRKLIALDQTPDLEIQIIGHQWWWELRYSGNQPSDSFATANELHIPVGRTVKLSLSSRDVIHSVWLPNLAGKKDVIPGRTEHLIVRPEREGVWHGRCAEFCGYQHAFMGLTVIVQSQEQFDTWQAAQRAPAAQPSSEEAQRGQQVFMQGPCALCHIVRGTDAAGYTGIAPDLTHLKSRRTIGAGAAPNTKGHLGGWIIDPHALKPGVHMPTMLQNADDFQALLAYLEGLQ